MAVVGVPRRVMRASGPMLSRVYFISQNWRRRRGKKRRGGTNMERSVVHSGDWRRSVTFVLTQWFEIAIPLVVMLKASDLASACSPPSPSPR